jgi:RHS repeat-associated protein
MSRDNRVNRRSGTTCLTRIFTVLFHRNKPFIYFGINCLVIFSMLAAQFVSFAKTAAAAAPERVQSSTTDEAASTPPEATPTPDSFSEPGSTQTSTDQPATTITATTGITVTPGITLATVTPIPTLTPTATAGEETVTATPSPTQAATNQPAAPSGQSTPNLVVNPQEPISITLSAVPGFITPGGMVNLFWDIANAPTSPAASDIQFTSSTNFEPRESSPGVYDADARVLSVIDAGPQGVTQWSAQPDSEAPVAITATLSLEGQVLDTYSLVLENRVYQPVGDHGGTLSAFGGRVSVTFPDGAADEPLEATIRNPKPQEMPPYSLSGSPFAIVARGVNSKNEYHQFKSPLTIVVACPSSPEAVFDPAAAITPTVSAPISTTVMVTATEVATGGQSTLNQPASGSGQCTPEQAGMTIFYYDVDQATWLPLPTQFDPQAGVLRATSDHLTVFDTDANNWQAARLPSTSSFQVAQFTGAATYSYPLWVPPGPGGLQPELSLSYNSQVVDSAFAPRTQASWVGMGWSLDTGYIERDMHGTMDDTSADDDTFTIVTNGISDMLLEGTDGYYHTVNESFWRIAYNSSTNSWTVWDRVGNIYRFGTDAQSRAVYPWFDFNCSHPFEEHTATWRWALKEIENPAGQKLTFSYTKDTKSTTHPCDATKSYSTDLAMYPSQIDYPNGKYRVVFTLESRNDYRNTWTASSSRTFYQQRRLNSVSIINVPSGTVMRKYQFSYNAVIYPGWTWDKGGQTFSLSSIQEFGLGASGSLPATTFSYADGMHLSQADNGYGGKVSFNFDATPWSADAPATGYEYAYDGTCPNGWTLDTGSRTCSSSSHMDITGSNHHDFGTTSVQPGAKYRVSLHVKNLSLQDSKVINLWMQSDASTLTVVQTYTLAPGEEKTLGGKDHEITLPKNANLLRLKVSCGNCRIFINDTRVDALLTRYRVTSRVVQDTVTGKSYTYSYRYDEPAVNDSAHSVAARDSNPYQSANSEFRGNVMSEEKGPDGRVSVTYYRQGDALKGNPGLTLVGTRSFEDAFDSINTSNWTTTAGLSTAPFMGDQVLVNYNPAANWNENIYRSSSQLADASGKPNTALVQFQVSGAGSQALLALENLDGGVTRRWGIWLEDVSGVFKAKVQYNTGSGWVYPTSFTVSRDHWYVLQLTVDNSAFLLRLWDRDDLTTVNEYKLAMPTGYSWRFRNWAWGGTVYLDDYSEGHLYQVSEYGYPSASSGDLILNTSLDLPKDSSGQSYDELKLYWPHQIEVRSLTYEGDGTYVETKTEYQYNPSEQGGTQYGNLNKQLEAKWTGSAWNYYRAQFSRFYPDVTSSTYIVGLPATDNHFKCPNGVCDFAASNIIDSKSYLYDGSTAFTTPPTHGLLTGERVLTRFNNGNTSDPRYSDTKYVYDSWGNRIQTTRYTGEGTSTALASSGAQDSYTCYGVANTPSSCSDDGYHSFIVWEKNAKGQQTTYTYDYTLALPVTQVDPNNVTTTVAYDIYGRLTKVIRSGDTASYPTLQVVYYDSWQPFMIDVHQRITAGASATYSQRKFYDGLGNLIQTQTPGAQLADNACSTDTDTNPDSCDLVTDSEFDAYGRVIKQTVAYPIQAWYSGLSPTPYRGQQLTQQPVTTTSYDILGRPLTVKATDATTTTYQYNLLSTRVTDAKSHVTINTLDEWGRTTVVTPPAGPAVTYAYDVADRLTDATRGGPTGYTSHTDYDLGGRKIATSDPDLGSWSYAYDALNLTRQTDARGQRICFYYDKLNDVTGKHYRSDDSCPASYTTPGVSYAYDAGTNGKGQRTSMTDASGSAFWTYDTRGRMTKETKTVSGAGTFVTQWGYNSADNVIWMKYPGGNASQTGEQVNFTYLPQNLINTVIGSTTYIKGSTYDATARLDLRELGLNSSTGDPILKTDYTYFPWTTANGQGRLKRLTTGTPTSTTSLQDLRYYNTSGTSAYDAVGNLLYIYDYKAGSPQTQAFAYDAADRLHTAVITGTLGIDGAYNLETYNYDSQGRLSGLPTMGSYSYSAAHLNAVEKINGVQKYWYDANGNMTKRVVGANTFNLTYDAENRLTGVSGAASNSYLYDGDGNRVKEVTYENLAAGLPFTSDTTLYWAEVPSDGDTWADSGSGTSGEFAYTGSGLHYVQLDLGAAYSVDKVKVFHYAADGRTYHQTKTQVSADGVTWTTIFDSATSGEYAETSAGHTLTFTARSVRYVRDYLNGSTSNANNHWVEIEVYGSRTVAYLGNYYEWDASSSAPTKYYYAGAEQVAMRIGSGSGTSGLEWLLDDQLGSTTITADGATGAKLSELRYKPWGEIRYAYKPTMTDLRYTGQRAEGIGLYDYGARWYDPALGRFVQADTVVPSTGDPQAWDRYAYVYNNPVKFVDPTGHMLDQGGGASSMGDDWWRNRQTTTKKTQTHNDPLLDPEYSNWRNLVRGSPCTACHVTHDTGRVPTNDELDPDLVDYYRSLDELALTIHLAAFGGVATQVGFSSEITASTIVGTTPWPDPWSGPQTVNGINYSQHALDRMAPVGLGGRGIPPSVVENALNFGTSAPAKEPGVMKVLFDNVQVIWNYVDNIVVTVIRTGH